jgi:oxygen-independent coproporphyrinogen-3 oxidase
VPRYTSFPTAAEFGPLPAAGSGPVEEVLAALPRGSRVSLYVHIPFCHEICWYCGCNTSRANKAERLGIYLEALHAELRLVADRLPPGTVISRIALGGGSPNALGPGLLLRLWDRLARAFTIASEATVSVETDPRTLDEPFTKALAAIGISRASLGVQTFTPAVQARIGRIQPEERIARATGLLRKAGVRSLNFDLMYGLPGQRLADVEDAIDRSTHLGADRIALFGYAHVPAVVPRQRRIAADALPTAHERFEMAAAGHDRLVSLGFQPVGFDHFARSHDPLAVAGRDGHLSRNFQGFTDDTADGVLGLGASAISSLPELLFQNEKNSGRYRMLTLSGRLPASVGIARGADDRARGAIITDLLCGRAADLGVVLPDPGLLDALAPFLERGLATLEGRRLSVTSAGLPYSRAIAACFDPYRAHPATRFSSAI